MKINILGIKITIKDGMYVLKPRALLNRLRYKLLKLRYPLMPTISEIELTNTCNLKCPNCPTPTTKYRKGFADTKTVNLALKYVDPDSTIAFHRLGEPLLHRQFLKYLKKAENMGLKIIISTNGKILTNSIAKKIAKFKIYEMDVSLHTKESVYAYKMMTDEFAKNKNFPLLYCGNVLSHNKEEVYKWIEEIGLDETAKSFLRDVPSHSWAGNVESRRKEFDEETRKRRVENCHFIKNNIVNVRWDGSVVACCLDSENVTELGHIKSFNKIKHNKNGYSLCKNCDMSWVNNYTE